MRVCLLIPTDLFVQPSIPVPYLRALRQARLLKRQGREVSVVSWIRWADSPLAQLPARETREGFDLVRVVLPVPPGGLLTRARFFLSLSARMAREARATGADAFVVHDPELLRAGLRAGRGKPVFYDAHEHFPGMVAQRNPPEARLIESLERRAARRLAHVYTVSEGIAGRFRAMGAPTTVTYNSRPLAEVEAGLVARGAARRAADLADADFVLGFVGSLAGDEGLELLLDALPLAPRETRLLAWGGPAPEAERLRALAASRGLAGRARFPGPVPGEQLFQRLPAFDVGALMLPDLGPNYRFRAPNKLFDYMAAGLPVLASPLEEPRRIVEETRCGLVVEREPKAVAAALTGLAKEPARRQRLGEAGRRAFRERYCWERMEERLRASHPVWA